MRFWASNNGATYLMVLMVVMIMGIMLAMTGQSWRQTMQREREEELLYRGLEIQRALDRWHNPGQGQPPASPLSDLKHLLKDPRSVANFKYLRRLYTDPMTGGEWRLITEPGRGIVGVVSTSNLTPIRQVNFPEELKELAGKEKYSEWIFAAKGRSIGLPAQSAPGVPTAANPFARSSR